MANSRLKLPKTPKLRFPGGGSKKRANQTPRSRLMSFVRGTLIYGLIALAALVFFIGFSDTGKGGDQVPISQVVNDVKEGKVNKIQVEGDKVVASYKDNKTVVSRKESGESIFQVLKSSDVDPKTVNIEVKDTSVQQAWLSLLGTVLPIGIMIVFFALIFRQAKDAGQGIFSFGQSRARLFSKDSPQIKFTDVAVVEEAKKELAAVV